MGQIHLNIGRVITQGQLSNNSVLRMHDCRRALLAACHGFNRHLSVLQTPGGFLYDYQDLRKYISGRLSTYEHFLAITKNAEKIVSQLMEERPLKELLKIKTEFVTLGIDVFDKDNFRIQAELVCTYNTNQEMVIYWTGKSYPTSEQEDSLIYCNNLETHFQKINGLSVLILGCHDLNLFSPRSRASVSKGSFRDKTISAMQALSDRFKPYVVLQHPHYTDSPNIWQLGWSGIKRWVPSARIYSSGIHYANREGKPPRKPLQSILLRTAQGHVEDFIVPLQNIKA